MRRIAVLVVLATLAGGLTACSGDQADPPQTEPSVAPTPLSAFDTGAVTVARADFCGLIPESAAERALGSPVQTTSDYTNGQRSAIAPGVHDVAHEFSCSYAAADGSTARAWVFAPQVSRRRARAMVRDLRRAKGCRTPEAPGFGRPSVATVCTREGDPEAAYHGLFVDAWLSCSLSGSGPDRKALLVRAGEWCVQVASAADTSSD